MRPRLWPWITIWAACLALVVSLYVVYSRLPADGMTGDMSSYSSQGFRLLWVLEPRSDGLRVNDVVVRAGGHSVDEWLSGAPRGPEWNTGGVVTYDVLRDGVLLSIPVRMAPVSLLSIVRRWELQLIAAAGFLLIGTFVFLKRIRELPARILMLFCVFTCMQYLGDGFNFQYAIMPLRWLFWAHFLWENLTYDIALSAACYFAFLYPKVNPLVGKVPGLVPAFLFAVLPAELLISMLAAPGWSHGIAVANQVSWIFLIVMVPLALAAALHSIRTAKDPVSRAQMRWILWSVSVGGVAATLLYVVPLILDVRPILPHPFVMLGLAGLALIFAIGILRFRLFEIDIIINRTLVYGSLTVVLMALYLVLVQLLSAFAEVVLKRQNDTVVLFLATLCIALAFAPLRQRVQLLIDRAFFRTRLDFQRLLPEMTEELAGSILVEQLAATLQRRLPQALQIS
ncbi:MAG TPA: hypothetical protein VFH83_02305, partial [Spirochaetia bacterium]|nr:hypothetical protein [Spirochaetia bacterium]